MSSTEGTIFNIQRYSIDDGPGIRTTVFVKGCPLRCLWCSNPESQSPLPELTYRYSTCKKCGKCVKACPTSAITLKEEGIVIDRTLCKTCGTCVRECSADALAISGSRMTVDQVLKTVKKDAVYYETSGGGVTASGGEILTQADFVAELFRRCKELDIHTCADTSGFGDSVAMEKILEHTDLVYFDLKHMNPQEHIRGVGQDNEIILNNLKLVAEKGIPVVIRIPMIPDYNCSEESLRAFAETVKDIVSEATVHLLPYHRYGANKYGMLGKTYPLEGLRTLEPEETESAKAIFESYGLTCVVSK